MKKIRKIILTYEKKCGIIIKQRNQTISHGALAQLGVQGTQLRTPETLSKIGRNFSAPPPLTRCRRSVDKSTRPITAIFQIPKRGISAVGSARHWQCRGHGFESRMLHNEKRHRKGVFFRYAHFIYGIRSSEKNDPVDHF